MSRVSSRERDLVCSQMPHINGRSGAPFAPARYRRFHESRPFRYIPALPGSSAPNSEEPPGAGDTFEFVFASVLEPDARACH